MKKIRLTFIILFLPLMLFSETSQAAEQEARIYKIEAAFLYNFFNYITWPKLDSPDELKEATICVYGNDELYQSLQYVREKKASERNLKIEKLNNYHAFSGCNILFIGSELKAPDIANISQKSGMLVASSIPGFIDKGGMIELQEENGRIVMSINNTDMVKSGFQISSRLLSIAKRVD